MKAFLPLLIFSLFLGCCSDEVIATYSLSHDEKALIPYRNTKKLTYVDSFGSYFTAVAGKRRSTIDTERTGPDSCRLWEYEVLESSVYVEVFNLDFRIIVQNFHDQVTFRIQRYFEDIDAHQTYSFDCPGNNLYDENLFKDISVNDYDFNEVLILKPCLLSHVNRVFYSKKYGIEYIEFDDGRYLKLMD